MDNRRLGDVASESDFVIVRLWKGRALAESADAYQAHVSTTVFPKLEQLRGYLRGRVLRRNVGPYVEFLVMTEWASLTAIRAFAGDILDRAVVEPAARAVLSDYDTHVEHFEVAREPAVPERQTLLRLIW